MNVDVSETIKERIWISDLDSVALYAAQVCYAYATPTLTPTNRENLWRHF